MEKGKEELEEVGGVIKEIGSRATIIRNLYHIFVINHMDCCALLVESWCLMQDELYETLQGIVKSINVIIANYCNDDSFVRRCRSTGCFFTGTP